MKREQNKKIGAKEKSPKWTRRSFAASLLAGAAAIMARIKKEEKASAPVSMKEASYYIPLDREEGGSQ